MTLLSTLIQKSLGYQELIHCSLIRKHCIYPQNMGQA